MRAKKAEQLSVFLKNRPGVLAELCEALDRRNVDIQAISVLESFDIGTVRLVVDNVGIAEESLTEFGAAWIVVPVLRLELPNKAGILARVAKGFAASSVNIEYMYATATPGADHTVAVFRVADIEMETALAIDFSEY